MFEDKAFRTQFIVAIFIALGGTLFLVMFLIVFGLKISNSTKDILSQKAEIISKQQKISVSFEKPSKKKLKKLFKIFK